MFTENYKPLRVQIVLALALIIGALAVRPAQAWVGIPTAQSIQTFHYIVFERYADGMISPVYYRLVEMANPPQSLTNSEINQALSHNSRSDEKIVVALETSMGQIVYQNSIRISPWLRGEFHGGTSDAPIDGHLISLDITSFVVRVPQIKDTTLILKNARLEELRQFDMQRLAVDTTHIQLSSSMEVEDASAASGPASNREDFLIMGDGYTSGQSTKFANDASAVASSFFSITPYSTYANYYNIHTLFTASAQSGADHPPYNPNCGYGDPTCCADPMMQSDPLRGALVNTAFDSRFCAFWVHRLLMGNTSKILAAAAAVPDWDSIMLIVNDTTYGGSGGIISVISMSTFAAQIAQHEYGHSFVGLADEYDSPSPGPTCSDISGNTPCEPNVTDVTNPLQIKWKPWINLNTPIPTPNNPAYQGIVGLFQGARYRLTGMYRPGYSCIMRFLGEPFCQVPSQAYVLRLYNGISLIEPDSLSPVSSQIFLTHPASQAFHGDILSPVGGPMVQVTWLDNGVPIPNATSSTYTFTTSVNKSGLRRITMRVKDITSLVIPTMAGNALQDEFTWTVAVDIPGVPTVVSHARANPSPTNADNVNFTVTFSEGVTGVDQTDFALTTTGGITNVAITNVTGSGNTYTVTVNTGSGNGTIRLDLIDNDSIADVAGNKLGGTGSGNGSFTIGEVYTIIDAAFANILVKVGGADQAAYNVPPNNSVKASYSGVNNGPVRVTSTNGVPIVASERVAYSPDGGTTWTSHSELMGLPANQLTNFYVFPWYNNLDLNSQLRFGNVGTVNTNVTVTIGGVVKGTYTLAPNASHRVSYAGLDAGPVRITSSGNVPIIASMRVAYFDGSDWTSFSEMMGMPTPRLTNSYVFPWYNNLDLNSQLRFGNVGNAPTTVTVTVGGVFKGAYTLAPNQSQRISYAGLDAGPVRITSSGNVPIIASMRVAYHDGSAWTDFSEMMGMPIGSLSTRYSFPVYNNVNLNTQLRFANVGNATTTVTVNIGGVLKGSYVLATGESNRISYAGMDSGPVVIQSSGGVPIIASERVAYFDGSDWTSFSEMMGLPQSQISTTYLFPWYNNVDLNTQLRFGVP